MYASLGSDEPIFPRIPATERVPYSPHTLKLLLSSLTKANRVTICVRALLEIASLTLSAADSLVLQFSLVLFVVVKMHSPGCWVELFPPTSFKLKPVPLNWSVMQTREHSYNVGVVFTHQLICRQLQMCWCTSPTLLYPLPTKGKIINLPTGVCLELNLLLKLHNIRRMEWSLLQLMWDFFTGVNQILDSDARVPYWLIIWGWLSTLCKWTIASSTRQSW